MDWIIDKSALKTIIALGLSAGDEVMIVGDQTSYWDNAVCRLTAVDRCVVLEVPNDPIYKPGHTYCWPSAEGKEYLERIVIGWRRPK